MTSTAEADRSPTISETAWHGPALGLAVLGWGANQFAPLIVLYERRLSLSSPVLNGIFGLYALGLIPALLVGGRLSDRRGRRSVLAAGLVVSLVATVVLIVGGDSATLLAVGRLLSGVASGVVFGTGAAWVKELSAEASDPAAGARRATVSMTIGFSAGPIVAGLCAQWLPAPTVLPYLPQLILLAVALVAVLRTPDLSQFPGPAERDAGVRGRPRRTGVAAHFALILVPFAPWVFGTAAIALAYLPALVAGEMGDHAIAFSAVAVGLTALTGILVQPVVKKIHRPGSARLLVVSMLVVLVALGCAAWAAYLRQPVLVLVASGLLGIAYGFTQFCGLSEVQDIADRASMGTATSLYQVLSYVGFAFPFLLALGQEHGGLSPSVLLLITLGAAAAVTVWLVAITSAYTHRKDTHG